MGRKFRGIALDVVIEDGRFTEGRLNSSQTVLGYDIALVRVSNILGSYRQGENILGGPRPTVGGHVVPGDEALQAMEALLARRRDEFAEFLKQHKVMVVFLAPPEEYAVFTEYEEREHPETGAKTRIALHARRTTLGGVLPFGIEVEPLRGTAFRLTAMGAFAEFWKTWETVFHHEAVITRHPGISAVQVGGSTKTVAAIIQHEGGTLLLLPDFDAFDYRSRSEIADGQNPAHMDFVDAIMALADRLSGEVDLPDWVSVVELPGERDARRRLSAAEAKAEEWRTAIEARREQLRLAERRKGLLTASGDALEKLVEEALIALGFEVEMGENGRVDRVLRLGDRVAVVEVKGQKGSAKEADAAQLSKWVAAYHADHGVQPKGLLVINAFSQTPLAQRTAAPFPHQMLDFAVNHQHFCLVTGEQLLAMWLAVDADPGRGAELAEGLLDCVGISDGPGLR